MRLPDNARPGIAAISIGAFVYTVLRLARSKHNCVTLNDGPIRVKGGAVVKGVVIVDNDDFEWEADTTSGKTPEYSYRGRPNRWNVSVWKNGVVCKQREARRVTIDIARDGFNNDGKLDFRANGGVRVLDEEGRFVASGKELVDSSKGVRIKKIELFPKRPNDMCEFDKSDSVEVELTPIP